MIGFEKRDGLPRSATLTLLLSTCTRVLVKFPVCSGKWLTQKMIAAGSVFHHKPVLINRSLPPWWSRAARKHHRDFDLRVFSRFSVFLGNIFSPDVLRTRGCSSLCIPERLLLFLLAGRVATAQFRDVSGRRWIAWLPMAELQRHNVAKCLDSRREKNTRIASGFRASGSFGLMLWRSYGITRVLVNYACYKDRWSNNKEATSVYN